MGSKKEVSNSKNSISSIEEEAEGVEVEEEASTTIGVSTRIIIMNNEPI